MIDSNGIAISSIIVFAYISAQIILAGKFLCIQLMRV